jgi:hypothetical protein
MMERHEGLRGVAIADGQRRCRHLVLVQHRKAGVHKDQRSGVMQIVGGAKAPPRPLVLGQPIHPAAGGPVEGHLLPVPQKEVLPEILAQLLEKVAQMAYQRVIAQNGVLLLGDVLDIPVDQPPPAAPRSALPD